MFRLSLMWCQHHMQTCGNRASGGGARARGAAPAARLVPALARQEVLVGDVEILAAQRADLIVLVRHRPAGFESGRSLLRSKGVRGAQNRRRRRHRGYRSGRANREVRGGRERRRGGAARRWTTELAERKAGTTWPSTAQPDCGPPANSWVAATRRPEAPTAPDHITAAASNTPTASGPSARAAGAPDGASTVRSTKSSSALQGMSTSLL